MKLIYRTVEGYQPSRPPEVDETSSRYTVYLRRNIRSVPNIGMDGEPVEGTHWEYEEAKLTKEEYQEYLKQIESPVTQLLMQSINDLQADIALLN